jgi:hypothetical protein
MLVEMPTKVTFKCYARTIEMLDNNGPLSTLTNLNSRVLLSHSSSTELLTYGKAVHSDSSHRCLAKDSFQSNWALTSASRTDLMMYLNNSSTIQRTLASDSKVKRPSASISKVEAREKEPTLWSGMLIQLHGTNSSNTLKMVSFRTARVKLLKSTIRMTKTTRTSSWQPSVPVTSPSCGRLNTLIRTHSTRSSVWLKTDHSHSSVPLIQA